MTSRAERERAASVRAAVIDSLSLASFFSLVFGVLSLISGEWNQPATLSWFLAPFVLSVGGRFLVFSYTNGRDRKSHQAGVVYGVLGFVVALGLGLAAFAIGNPVILPVSTLILTLGASLSLAIMAWVVAKVWPVPAAPTVDSQHLTTDEGIHQLKVALRQRGDMSDARVRSISDGARSELETDQRAINDFGSPHSYARSFSVDKGVRARRRATFSLVTTGFVLILLVIGMVTGDPSPWMWGWLALIIGFGISKLQSFRAARPA